MNGTQLTFADWITSFLDETHPLSDAWLDFMEMVLDRACVRLGERARMKWVQ